MNNNYETKKFSPSISTQPYMIHGGDYNPDQWLDMPEIIDEDIRLMKLAKINSASVGIFAWQKLEPQEGQYNFEWLDNIINKLYKNDIHVILATPSGARPAWMDAKYKEVLRVNSDRTKNLHGARHNHCYTSPYYRKKVYEINHILAERYKNHPAISMWHLSNEYGGECHCELCQNAFREWLKVQYDNDINKLNQAWWTSFWGHGLTSFEQVESPSNLGDSNLHGLNLDWKRFVTYQTTDFIKNEKLAVKSVTPNIPVVTNLMGTYEGLDPHVIAKEIDVITWDNYPEWHNTSFSEQRIASDNAFLHDINRCLKNGQPFMLMESTPSLVNWKSVNKLKRPKMHKLSAIQAIAHGSDSIQYFQWRKSRGASEKLHGAVVDHCGHENTRVFKEVTDVGNLLSKLHDIVGTTIKPNVAIIFDWQNRWAIDDLQGLSFERDYESLCKTHYSMMWKRGISVDIINMEQCFNQYKLIIAPFLYMLKPNVANRLNIFVKNGGTLILTYQTGYVNQNDLCYLGGFPGDGLQEVAGIWAEEIDSLYSDESNSVVFGENSLSISGAYQSRKFCEIIHTISDKTEILAVYGDDFYKSSPAITKNSFGKGNCYYIATDVSEECLDAIYQPILDSCDICSALSENQVLPDGVTVQQRYGDNQNFIFMMNFSTKRQTIKLNTKYRNLETNEIIHGMIVLEGYGGAILMEIRDN